MGNESFWSKNIVGFINIFILVFGGLFIYFSFDRHFKEADIENIKQTIPKASFEMRVHPLSNKTADGKTKTLISAKFSFQNLSPRPVKVVAYYREAYWGILGEKEVTHALEAVNVFDSGKQGPIKWHRVSYNFACSGNDCATLQLKLEKAFNVKLVPDPSPLLIGRYGKGQDAWTEHNWLSNADEKNWFGERNIVYYRHEGGELQSVGIKNAEPLVEYLSN